MDELRISKVGGSSPSERAAARDFYTDYLGLSVEDFNLGWVAHHRSSDSAAHI